MPIAVIYNGAAAVGAAPARPRHLPLMGAGLLLPLVIMMALGLACL
jgi:hypothetical protein